MNIRELIEELQDLIEHDETLGDAEVLIATQRNYPLAFATDTITLDVTNDQRPLLWIAEEGHPHDLSPYAPRFAWDGGVVDDSCDECSDETATSRLKQGRA
jgi:hypothetical protein